MNNFFSCKMYICSNSESLLIVFVNQFHTHVPFLYPLKTSESQSSHDIFRGYRNGTWVWNRLIKINNQRFMTFRPCEAFYVKMENIIFSLIEKYVFARFHLICQTGKMILVNSKNFNSLSILRNFSTHFFIRNLVDKALGINLGKKISLRTVRSWISTRHFVYFFHSKNSGLEKFMFLNVRKFLKFQSKRNEHNTELCTLLVDKVTGWKDRRSNHLK